MDPFVRMTLVLVPIRCWTFCFVVLVDLIEGHSLPKEAAVTTVEFFQPGLMKKFARMFAEIAGTVARLCQEMSRKGTGLRDGQGSALRDLRIGGRLRKGGKGRFCTADNTEAPRGRLHSPLGRPRLTTKMTVLTCLES